MWSWEPPPNESTSQTFHFTHRRRLRASTRSPRTRQQRQPLGITMVSAADFSSLRETQSAARDLAGWEARPLSRLVVTHPLTRRTKTTEKNVKSIAKDLSDGQHELVIDWDLAELVLNNCNAPSMPKTSWLSSFRHTVSLQLG